MKTIVPYPIWGYCKEAFSCFKKGGFFGNDGRNLSGNTESGFYFLTANRYNTNSLSKLQVACRSLLGAGSVSVSTGSTTNFS